jgi:hypothetical protein
MEIGLAHKRPVQGELQIPEAYHAHAVTFSKSFGVSRRNQSLIRTSGPPATTPSTTKGFSADFAA